LIRAWNDRLGDGDQLPLLIENAQARGLLVAGVELRWRALSSGQAAGLDLRERKVEFSAARMLYSIQMNGNRSHSDCEFSNELANMRVARFKSTA
jgi:hypothetical protein